DRFDLAAFWTESSAAYERDTPRLQVVLRLAGERLARLHGVIGDRPFETLERLDEPDPDGWQRIRLWLDWPTEAVSQVLAVGPDCELLEPHELRDRIAAQARKVAAQYGPEPLIGITEGATGGGQS
ncbi:MAG: WYL domain-containing protein, partial [Candidatus Limnocylindrales bacterium]